jgi:hypothetical protein
MANRVVNSLDDGGLAQILLTYDLDERVLASHCLDAEAIGSLRLGHGQQFLEKRAAVVEKVISDHVQSHALFGFRDGPDVTALFDEDDELD